MVGLSRRPLTPIYKGRVFNTAVLADTDIFDDLSPSNTPTTFRVYACFDTAGVLSVRRTRAEATVSEQLNSGTNLTADAAYTFDVVVEAGDTINFRFSVAATCLALKILEVPGVIS